MARQQKTSKAAASYAADALCARLDDGYLRLYDGVRPADADTAVGSQVMLAELRFGSPAFDAAVDGVATARAITRDSSANASGEATWLRCLEADGETAVIDGNVGTEDADCVLTTRTISAGAIVSIGSYTYTHNRG